MQRHSRVAGFAGFFHLDIVRGVVLLTVKLVSVALVVLRPPCATAPKR